MRTFLTLGRRLCMSLLGLIALPAMLSAAEPAREDTMAWQFKPGQALRWTLDQSIQLRAPEQDKIVEANFKQVFDFDVDVASVEQGVTTLAVSTSRIRVIMDLPDGKMSYDSAAASGTKEKKNANSRADDDPPAKNDDPESDDVNLGEDLIAGMLAPMRDLKYSVTVDKQGAVQAVKIDEKKLNVFKSVRPLQAFMVLFEKEGFSSAYLGGFVKLPASDLPAGQTWNSKVVSFGSGLVGKATFEHVFRRDGIQKVDGRELQKFSATVQMAFDGRAGGPFKLGKQTGTGVLYFDAHQGYVPSSQWTLTAQLLLDDAKVEGKLKMETKSQIRDRGNSK